MVSEKKKQSNIERQHSNEETELAIPKYSINISPLAMTKMRQSHSRTGYFAIKRGSIATMASCIETLKRTDNNYNYALRIQRLSLSVDIYCT